MPNACLELPIHAWFSPCMASGVNRLQLIMDRKLLEGSSKNNSDAQRKDILNAVQVRQRQFSLSRTISHVFLCLNALSGSTPSQPQAPCVLLY